MISFSSRYKLGEFTKDYTGWDLRMPSLVVLTVVSHEKICKHFAETTCTEWP